MKRIVIDLKGNGHPKFYKFLEEMGILHDKKNSDYATKENPLANFERVGKIARMWNIITPGNEAEKVCIIYLLKQLDAVGKLVGLGVEGKVETRGERYSDVSVYSLIGRILSEEFKES